MKQHLGTLLGSLATVLCASGFAQNSEPFDGTGPGVSTVGPGGTYETLADAFSAVTSLTGGDWVFEIIGDQTVNDSAIINLFVTSDGSGFIVRPAEGTSPVITFSDSYYLTYESAAPLLIDGSNNGTDSRDLTIMNTTSFQNQTGLLNLGNAKNVEIRNATITNNYSQSGPQVSAAISLRGNGPEDYTENLLVTNCELRADRNAFALGALITFHPGLPDTANTESFRNIVFRDNDIYGGQRAFWLNHFEDITIDNNRLYINQTSQYFSFHGLLHFITPGWGWITGATLNFRNNRFINISTASRFNVLAVHGLLLDALGDNTYNIENNFIGGIEVTGLTGELDKFGGVTVATATSSTINIRHNSIDWSGLPAGIASNNSHGIGITNSGFTGTVNIQNNIVRVGAADAAAIQINSSLGTYVSDSNVLYTEDGPIGRYNGIDSMTLEEWQNAGFDGSSSIVDPYEPIHPFPGKWLLGGDGADLHFVGAIGPSYLVPRIPSLPIDIDGESRPDPTFAGADHPEDSDGDGIPGIIEDLASNDGDGNNDSIPDRIQGYVASIATLDGDAILSLAVPSTQNLLNAEVSTAPTPEGAAEGAEFPYGLLSFDVTGMPVGGSTTVDVYLPEDTAINYWYKYSPTADDSSDHWYPYLFDGTTGVIFGNPLRIHFVDGARGDADLTANGIITDPSAPAITDISLDGWHLH